MASGRVYTVKMAVVRRGVLSDTMAKIGLPVSDTDSVEELVERYFGHLKLKLQNKEITQGDLGQCPTCDGYSEMSLDCCPYCGEADDEPEETSQEISEEVVEDEPEEVVEENVQVEPEDVVEEVVEETVAKPPKAKKERDKRSAKRGRPPKVKAESVTIEKTDDCTSEVITVGDLDRTIDEIKQAAIDTASGLYRYGRLLQKIHDLELWKLRLSDKGSPVYRSFDAFCQAEIAVSRQHAYRLMAVSSEYTPEQLEHYGVSKLHLSLQVPEELRSKLLGDGSESTRAISNKAKSLMGDEERSRHTPRLSASDKAKAVTVAIVPGIVEVPMYKRPSGDWPAGKPTKPAKTLNDDPWFMMELTNDVTLSVRLTRSAEGEIIAIVEHRRGTQAS